jgi:uncharacterized membrane protein YdfJ with MMPL/SSD domain
MLVLPVTSFLVNLNVTFCLVEILGFLHTFEIAIDLVSVINIVLAVGLSIDLSAHVGHCFMHKGGKDKDACSLEALANIGASVFNGAATMFLAVLVLLFSNSYVFQTLSIQFALTAGLGSAHGLFCQYFSCCLDPNHFAPPMHTMPVSVKTTNQWGKQLTQEIRASVVMKCVLTAQHAAT